MKKEGDFEEKVGSYTLLCSISLPDGVSLPSC